MTETVVRAGGFELDQQLEGLAERLAVLASAADRKDFAASLRSEIERTDLATTTVLVVGHVKVGKSSLINALLERPGLSPVNVDVATNVHIVFHHADPETTTVFRDGDTRGREIGREEIAAWATVDGNPYNEKRVHTVEVGIDHPLLAEGLTLIDTPGVGGLEATHTSVTLEALSRADALVFVTSARAPLSKPELDFLARATERVKTVLFVATKIEDTDWRTILDEDRTPLAKAAPAFAELPSSRPRTF